MRARIATFDLSDAEFRCPTAIGFNTGFNTERQFDSRSSTEWTALVAALTNLFEAVTSSLRLMWPDEDLEDHARYQSR
jgi:hypothetical protein